MPASNTVNAKRRGRPVTTGTGHVVGVRLQPDDLAKLDAWIASQDAPPSRPEAVRVLLRQVLQ